MSGIDFSGITMPFSPADLLKAGVDLFGSVGLFVILGLAFVIAPKFISLLWSAVRSARKA